MVLIVCEELIELAHVAQTLPHTVGVAGVAKVGDATHRDGFEVNMVLDGLTQLQPQVPIDFQFYLTFLALVELFVVDVEVGEQLGADLVEFDVIVACLTLETGLVEFGAQGADLEVDRMLVRVEVVDAVVVTAGAVELLSAAPEVAALQTQPQILIQVATETLQFAQVKFVQILLKRQLFDVSAFIQVQLPLRHLFCEQGVLHQNSLQV